MTNPEQKPNWADHSTIPKTNPDLPPPTDEELDWERTQIPVPGPGWTESSEPIVNGGQIAQGESSFQPFPPGQLLPPPAPREEIWPDEYAGTDLAQVLGVAGYTFVDSTAAVTGMLDSLTASLVLSDAQTPVLAMDLEGLELGKRAGQIYLLQIYDSFARHLTIVDVLTLGPAAFTTQSSDGRTTLEDVLVSEEILKVFCDPRGDAYGLFKEFGIRLRGVRDVQNMDIAARIDPDRRKRRSGLRKLIEVHAGLSAEETRSAMMRKMSGRDICRRRGYRQFGVRPLRQDLAVYAGNDVLYLLTIYETLREAMSQLSAERLESAIVETEKSIRRTWEDGYNPDQGQSVMTLANWDREFDDDDGEPGADFDMYPPHIPRQHRFLPAFFLGPLASTFFLVVIFFLLWWWRGQLW